MAPHLANSISDDDNGVVGGNNSDNRSNNEWVAEFGDLRFVLPQHAFPGSSEHALKEWVWETCKDEILAGMTVRRTAATASSSSTVATDDSNSSGKEDEEEEESPERTGSIEQRLDLLERVAFVQNKCLQSEGPKEVYNCLLDGLLDIIGSEFGFIGEWKKDEDDVNYLHVHASTNVAWNAATRKFYEENHALKFYNMDTLFGRVLTGEKPVISNDAKNDSRATGTPKGHPVVNTFLVRSRASRRAQPVARMVRLDLRFTHVSVSLASYYA